MYIVKELSGNRYLYSGRSLECARRMMAIADVYGIKTVVFKFVVCAN